MLTPMPREAPVMRYLDMVAVVTDVNLAKEMISPWTGAKNGLLVMRELQPSLETIIPLVD
jgi:hypothetical protein